ncbi:MAG: protein kinase domain-containing protein [Myxococcales bacterium]
MDSRWQPPTEFDDYLLLQPLGSGSTGQVYLAEDQVLARRVAIKFATVPQPDAALRQRFLIEARAAARVQHPNVVSIYRVGELEDRPYLITEFVRGRSLEQIEKPMPWERALAIGIDLSRGLSAAHRNGVVHCDIKSANAILPEEGGAKLLDFGLATLVKASEDGAERSALPRRAGIRGTPAYMAPEIWRGEAPTRRSDVYSLGALLFELVTGKPPFDDVPAPDLPRVVQEREPRALRSRSGPAEARFSAVVERCLRRDPAERYASGDEVREALEQAARIASAPSLPEGNPYRGLRAFEAGHRALFFGRGAEIGVVVDRLRSDPFVLVAGDSGVGKSSLCRAGVIPAILDGALGPGRRWIAASLVPGRNPLASLAAALAPALETDVASLALAMKNEPGTLARMVAKGLGDGLGLLVFVDQLEELLTISDPEETRLVDFALAALASGLPGVRLLATLRADFITRFAGIPQLSEDLSRVLFVLRPLTPERMRDVILGPAQVTGTRFESEAMVEELVAATAAAEGSLPLLQFALAELWEGRDRATNTITRAALESVGGVDGALARHADAVLTGLLPSQRAAARRLLSRLVTLEGTRARRTDDELGTSDPAARDALDALVRGRLVVAQDAEHGSAYEVAHEVLVRGWGTLKRWLEEDAEERIVREGLSRAAAEWERLGRSRDALLGQKQVEEIEGIAALDLSDLERAFLDASRRTLHRRRWIRLGLAALVVLVALGVYAGARLSAQSELERRVNLRLSAASAALGRARAARAQGEALRSQAFARFDAHDREGGQQIWTQALSAMKQAERSLGEASRDLEAGLAQDPGRGDVRGLLADALYERALAAELAGHAEQRDESVERFSLYDRDGSRRAKWEMPARVSVGTDPGASAVLERAGVPGARQLGNTPLRATELPAGSYVLTLSAPGRATVRAPFLVSRGEELALRVPLPAATSVPAGFVYVPAGRFLFGSAADEETRRGFFDTVPLHAISTGPYLIAQSEVTWADWLAFLRALPERERTLRTPSVLSSASTSSTLHLTRLRDGRYKLTLQPARDVLSAAEGDPLVYPRRKENASVDWRRLPVTGISGDDGEAYVLWLRSSGRVAGARLCSELEWERAARGADGRSFPNGSDLSPADANYDDTHGKESLGPDEVGSHPASRSPFGIDDASGNAFEWVKSWLNPGEYLVRGGSYFHDRTTAQLPNRNVSVSSTRDATLGLRVCADPP